MKIEDIKELLEEIEPDKDGYGYIDCGTATEYMDCSRYRRIIAAIKQCLALHSANDELTKKIEEVESQNAKSLSDIEILNEGYKERTDIINNLLRGLQEHLLDIYSGKESEVRIGDYIFFIKKDHVDLVFEPIKKDETVELTIKITENSDYNKECPICGNPLGKYPAISREDNKTKICSNCGTLEALAVFKESLKEEK